VSGDRHELVVVGAGPAGVSAALWARARELDVLLLEAGPGPGGQLQRVYFEPREIAGWAGGDGQALAGTYRRQLVERAIPVRFGAAVERLVQGDDWSLVLAGGEELRARAVLVASGARARRLDVPGEREFEDRGVSTSATRDRARLAGRTVVVVGGGDAAFENALHLAGHGGQVTLLVRGAPRARHTFRERVARESRIEVRTETRVTAIEGDSVVRAVRVAGPGGGSRIACEGVVVKVGVVPNTEWCADVLARDPAGHVRVGPDLATSAPGVWAAGDATGPTLPCVPVAHGQGALAIAAIRTALRRD